MVLRNKLNKTILVNVKLCYKHSILKKIQSMKDVNDLYCKLIKI